MHNNRCRDERPLLDKFDSGVILMNFTILCSQLSEISCDAYLFLIFAFVMHITILVYFDPRQILKRQSNDNEKIEKKFKICRSIEINFCGVGDVDNNMK